MDRQLFRESSERIRIYVGKEVIQDPTELNVEIEMLNPIPISAVVSDLTTTQASYKLPGIEVNRAKQIIVEKNKINLLLLSQKIMFKGDTTEYEGWKKNGEMQYRRAGDYYRLYVYSK